MALFRRAVPKLFVWDFHGVLEQGTEHAVLEVTNAVLAQCGYREQLTSETNKLLYRQKMA